MLTAASASGAPATAPATQPARGDTLVVSAIIDAPADEIFQCFTTSQGLVRAWGVAKAKVDFRVGGEIRDAYDMETDLDSAKAIVNTILAFVPGKMLAIKPTAPQGAPDWLEAICKTGWNVIELEPLGAQRTRLTITGMGFGTGPLYDKAYAFFKQGNEWTLKRMQETLGHPNLKLQDVNAWEQLKSRVGGEWIAEKSVAGNNVFRARVKWESALDGNVLIAKGFIGDASGLHEHATVVAYLDPASGAVRFEHFCEGGHVAHGTFVMLDDNTMGMPLAIEVPANQQGGERFAVMRKNSDDAYHLSVFASQADAMSGAEPMVDLDYRRVSEVPPEFRQVKPPHP
jgi:uncharacterized protein YndB with AHSA1/START domain